MLSLYKLEVFNAAAREGSFSRAAEKMMLSQPAISQHIRDLEGGFGADLFLRGPRGVKLTPAGETLLDYTRCILRLVSEAETAVGNLDRLPWGKIAIGATPGASVHLLPDWIRAFHARFSDLSISLLTDTTDSILEGVLAGDMDIGIVEGEMQAKPPLLALVLQEIPLYLVVAADHPWSGMAGISIKELKAQPFITRPVGSQTRAWIDQVLERHGVQPDTVAEFDHPESIKGAVASGMGVTILPAWGIQPEEFGGRLHVLPLSDVDLRRTLKLVRSQTQPLKPVTRAFLSHLADRFPQITRWTTSGADANLDLPERERYQASLSCASEEQSVS